MQEEGGKKAPRSYFSKAPGDFSWTNSVDRLPQKKRTWGPRKVQWCHFSQVIQLSERPFQRPWQPVEFFLSKKALQTFTVASILGRVLPFIGEADGGMAECLDLWVPVPSHLKEVLLRVPSTPHWEASLSNWVPSQNTCSSLKINPKNVFSCPFETLDYPLNSTLRFPKKSLTFSRLCIFI